MKKNNLASSSHPPEDYNPEMCLVCAYCSRAFKGNLEEMIRLGWEEYIGKDGKIAVCPDCEKKGI